MATSKSIPYIKVSRNFKKLGTSALIQFGRGIKFSGDHDATTPPNIDAVIATSIGVLEATHNLRQTDSSKGETSIEKAEKNTVNTQLNENASYLEMIANKISKATGDVNMGCDVVTRIGYVYTIRGGVKRNVGFIDSGIGWAHAHEAKSRKGIEAHYFEYGITTARGTPPTTLQNATTVETDLVFTNLKSGVILAYHHASIASCFA